MSPIKLHSVISDKYITITWFITSKCNYKCFYCTDTFNSGKSLPKDYMPVIKFIKEVQDKYPEKSIRLFFMGGEISLWKQFNIFVKKVKQLTNTKIIIISNGSFSIDWLKENIDYVDFVLISYHHQYANKKHFIEVSKLINHKGQILLMVPHDKFDEVKEIGRQISKESKISVLPKLLRVNFKNEFYSYTEKQLRDIKFIGPEYFPENCKPFTSSLTKVSYNNQTKEKLKASDLIRNNLNKLYEWICFGGIDNFFINVVGDVFVGQCKANRLGNIYKEKIELPDKPFVCKEPICICTVDLESCTKIKKGKRV